MPDKAFVKLESRRLRLFRTFMYLFIIAFLANLNALVDLIHHPEIPYLDEEHLIVGGISALFCSVFALGLEYYLHHLNTTRTRLHKLESFLSICANCKRIRPPGRNPAYKDSWENLETYVNRMTKIRISHGICPVCKETLYSNLFSRSVLSAASISKKSG